MKDEKMGRTNMTHMIKYKDDQNDFSYISHISKYNEIQHIKNMHDLKYDQKRDGH